MIVVTAIQTLGSYQAFLAAVVMCGAIQIGLGMVGAGAIGDYVPNSVIKGMLAGIGSSNSSSSRFHTRSAMISTGSET